MNETNKEGVEMTTINNIDLTKGLEVFKFATEIAKELGYDVVEKDYDEDDFWFIPNQLECCFDELEQGSAYSFCLEDSSGNVDEVYCGSKCFLREYNLKNRFNEDWTQITNEQFSQISENC